MSRESKACSFCSCYVIIKVRGFSTISGNMWSLSEYIMSFFLLVPQVLSDDLSSISINGEVVLYIVLVVSGLL